MNRMEERPRIFIMSSERSGSNLLRRILGRSSNLATPPAPQLFRVFSDLVPYYGDLQNEEACRALVADCIRMVSLGGTKFDWATPFSVEEVMEKLSRKSLTGVVAALYDLYADKSGTEGWVCKENDLFDHASSIRSLIPDAKFIYLVRDGRDVAVSEKKIPTRSRHVFYTAEKWKKEQQTAVRSYQELPQRDRLLVRYEDLLEDPKAMVEKLCERMEIPFEEAMLEHHKDEKADDEASRSRFWENLSKPIMAGNKKKFQKELTEKERYLFEQVAGEGLKMLGYEPEFWPVPRLSGGKELRIRVLNLLKKTVRPPRKDREEDALHYQREIGRIARERRKSPKLLEREE